MSAASPSISAPGSGAAPLATRLDPPGWLHRLVEWIDRLPGPPGLVYAATFVLGLLVTQGAAWSSGARELGEIDALNVYWGAFGAALLWVAGYLERLAARAFETIRPRSPWGARRRTRCAGGWWSFPRDRPRSSRALGPCPPSPNSSPTRSGPASEEPPRRW